MNAWQYHYIQLGNTTFRCYCNDGEHEDSMREVAHVKIV